MVKSVFAPHLSKHVKLGRTRPDFTSPRLRLGNYLARKALPAPPSNLSYTAAAMTSLSNVYLNDQLGCCVVSGAFHARGVTSANAGQIVLFNNNQIIHDYSAIGGYVPGDPSTDNGCDEVTALNYWTQTGFPDGVKLAGWLSIDATNKTEIQQAIWLFENCFYGMELPDAWLQNMPSANGFTWDVAGQPVPTNGHCVAGFGYDQVGVTIDTWGMLGKLTWAATAKYAVQNSGGELHVLLSPDMLIKAQAKAPNGLDWPSLIKDFDAMGGNLPIPGPTPNPNPGPNPPPPQPSPNALFPITFPKVQAGQRVTFRAPVNIPAGNYLVVPSTHHAMGEIVTD